MKGLILIPDMSGFTNFVNTVDLSLGVRLTNDLLTTIIDNNPLDLEISEIEGDAILFYKLGQPLSVKRLFSGMRRMYEAFSEKFQALKAEFDLEVDLSLKFIVHYGELDVYEIRGFKKLYGQMVIESHNLLKNGAGESDYILITEDYFEALNDHAYVAESKVWEYKCSGTKIFNDLRKVLYHFYSYCSQRLQLTAIERESEEAEMLMAF